MSTSNTEVSQKRGSGTSTGSLTWATAMSAPTVSFPEVSSTWQTERRTSELANEAGSLGGARVPISRCFARRMRLDDQVDCEIVGVPDFFLGRGHERIRIRDSKLAKTGHRTRSPRNPAPTRTLRVAIRAHVRQAASRTASSPRARRHRRASHTTGSAALKVLQQIDRSQASAVPAIQPGRLDEVR